MRSAKPALFFTVLSGLLLVIALVSASCGSASKQSAQSRERTTGIAEIAAEIERLEAPTDVDGGLFESLKAELLERLKERADILGSDRFKAVAPKEDAGMVTDLEIDPDSGMLRWSYANLGDYDFDGKTAVPDITPIALHYLQVVGDGQAEEARQAWIDGNGDGIIGIPDITPIALNYLGEVFEYGVYAAGDEEGPFEEVARVPYTDGSEDLPKSFQVEWNAEWPRYAAVRALDRDGEEGDLSNVVDTIDIMPKDLDIVQGSFTISVLVGNSGQRDINIKNNTEEPIEWTLSVNQDWMELSQDSGTNDGGEEITLTVYFLSEDMGIGSRSGRITLDWDGGSDFCNVILRVVSEAPLPVIEQENILFDADLGEILTQTLDIRNDGNLPLNWQVSADQPWLSFTPESGTLGALNSGTLQVTASSEGLSPGNYNAVITLFESGNPGNSDSCGASLTVTDIGETLSHIVADGSLSGNGTPLDPWMYSAGTGSVQFRAYGTSGKEITNNTLMSFALGDSVAVSPGTAFSQSINGRLIWGAFDTNVQIAVQFRGNPNPSAKLWIYKNPVEE